MNPNYKAVFDYSTSEIESEPNEQQMIRNKLVKNQLKNKSNNKSEKQFAPEAIKVCFLYHPETEIPELGSFNNCIAGYYIEKKYCFPQNNRNMYKKKIWGTEYYHYRSDIILVLYHSGLLTLESLKSPKVEGYLLICQISKRKNFKESFSNGVYSQKLNGQDKDGFTLKPIRLDELENFYAKNVLFFTDKLIFRKKVQEKRGGRYISPSSNLSLYCCKFNKSNDMVIQYSLENISDKSKTKEEFLSHRLEDSIMILETVEGFKYKIEYNLVENDQHNTSQIFYSLSKFKNPLKADRSFFERNELETSLCSLEMIFEKVKWNEFVWDQHQMYVRGRVIANIDNLMFLRKNDLNIQDYNDQN